jgi:hypothetical protein
VADKVDIGGTVTSDVSEFVWNPSAVSFSIPDESASLVEGLRKRIIISYSTIICYVELKQKTPAVVLVLNDSSAVQGLQAVKSVDEVKRKAPDTRINCRIILFPLDEEHVKARDRYPRLAEVKGRCALPKEMKKLEFWLGSKREGTSESPDVRTIFRKAAVHSLVEIGRDSVPDTRRSLYDNDRKVAGFDSPHADDEGTSPPRRSKRKSSTGRHRSWPVDTYVTYPPRSVEAPSRVTIYPADVKLLKPSECLNDTLIEYFQKRVLYTIVPEEKRNRIYFFNSFFLQRLTRNVTLDRYKAVARWTKGDNLFEKSVVIIAVNEAHHWKLMVIFNLHHAKALHEETLRIRERFFAKRKAKEKAEKKAKKQAKEQTKQRAKEQSSLRRSNRNRADASSHLLESSESDDSDDDFVDSGESENPDTSEESPKPTAYPFVLFLDSLGGGVDMSLHSAVAKYLEFLYKDQYPGSDVPPFRNSDFLKRSDGHRNGVPLQTNAVDCGMYVLMYMEKLAKMLEDDHDLSITEDNIFKRIRAQLWKVAMTPKKVKQRRLEEWDILDDMYAEQNKVDPNDPGANSGEEDEESSGDLEIVEKAPKRRRRTRRASEVSRQFFA